jgi:UPF0755 protein
MLRAIKGLTILLVICAAAAAGALYYYEQQELTFAPAPLAFDLKPGSSLRTASRDLSAAGVIGEPSLFELIGRLHGNAPHIKAGNYEFESPTTPLKVLQKITRGDATQVSIRFIDGWTFKQMPSPANWAFPTRYQKAGSFRTVTISAVAPAIWPF